MEGGWREEGERRKRGGREEDERRQIDGRGERTDRARAPEGGRTEKTRAREREGGREGGWRDGWKDEWMDGGMAGWRDLILVIEEGALVSVRRHASTRPQSLSQRQLVVVLVHAPVLEQIVAQGAHPAD
jgi:hypothetical protein